jgi:release factor glutamine methyltransferase
MNEIYEPEADSFLLEKYVKKFAKGHVLDIGTGSGIQAKAAALKADSVIAIDINQKAIDYCKEHIKAKNIEFIHSDLFSAIHEGTYDFIIFNAPYLPSDPRDPDLALDGGKEGYEIIERFLSQVKKYLDYEGIILLIFSSKTNKEKVDVLIKNNNFQFELLEKIHIFFEDIYCYKITRKIEE